MSVGRWITLVGIALLVMIGNVAASVVYMVLYGHLINPGHPAAYYQAHIEAAAPYCGLAAGIPLMFLAGVWVGRGRDRKTAARSAWIVWSAYALLDFAILLAAGLTLRVAIFFVASFLTRLAAVYLGAVTASRPRP